MKNRVITISREFGSGGRTIGKKVAEKLEIPCYDAKIIQEMVKETGFAPNYVKEAGEYAPGGFLSIAFSNRMFGPTNEDILWEYQYKIITQLAEKEPCVIVGRCADYILRNRPHCMRIFLHAPAEYRVKRIMRTENLSHDAALTKAIQMNRKRSDNYHYYTHQPWGLSRNYHLTLDTSLGDDFVLDSICEGLKHIQ